MEIVAKSTWHPAESLLIAELKGPVTGADVTLWEKELTEKLAGIPENSQFRIFVDLFGLAPANVEAHKRYRSVIPLALARHGWRVGYLNLFPEADGLKLSEERGVRCIKAAHAHQDAYKIDEYERRFGKASERFFTDSTAALRWLREP